MYKLVFSSYRFLISIVNDQDDQMTSILWRCFCQRYGINIKFFLAHHLEIDGQTKNANKVIKNYLRAYISHLQDNWVDHLSMAEFAANNHVNISIGIISFFADNSFYPRICVEPSVNQQNSQKIELLAADKIVKNQEDMALFLQDQLI